MKPVTWCTRYGACEDATAWVSQYDDWADAWDACERADWMLWLMRKKHIGNDRDLRLFACWCVRQVWHLLKDESSKAAVEVAERYANGAATKWELAAARDTAWAPARDAAGYTARTVAWAARDTARTAARDAAGDAAAGAAAWAARGAWTTGGAAWAVSAAALKAQADKLREMFGNPFRTRGKR